jgi:acetoin utilization deacetylase AcuC-like enzyme
VQVFFSTEHCGHRPQTFLSRGQVKPCPEVAERADILSEAVRGAGHPISEPHTFGLPPIERVHDSGYLEFLDTAWSAWSELGDFAPEIVPNVHPGRHMQGRPTAIVGRAGYYQSDTACPIGPGTWAAAQSSANVALSAARAVVSGSVAQAYALCRPPGHHAFSDMAGGFCFLNNTAIVAQYCRDQGAAKVAIVDVDVHHGNGTQQIFYQRDDVLTVSLHGDPAVYYPFYLGYANEYGALAGDGFNLNIPIDEGTRDDVYLSLLSDALHRVREFAPDVLVVALGLDASEHDGHHPFLKISTDGFAKITQQLAELELPSVLVQEGGYVSAHLGANLASALAGFERGRS